MHEHDAAPMPRKTPAAPAKFMSARPPHTPTNMRAARLLFRYAGDDDILRALACLPKRYRTHARLVLPPDFQRSDFDRGRDDCLVARDMRSISATASAC